MFIEVAFFQKIFEHDTNMSVFAGTYKKMTIETALMKKSFDAYFTNMRLFTSMDPKMTL